MDTEIDWASLHKDATTTLEGEFPVVITKAITARSQTDKPMIKATVKVESGPMANRELYTNFTISAESSTAMRIFFGQMSVLGIDGTFFAQNPTLEMIAQALVGRRAIAEVGSRTWQGTEREEIKNWKPALGGVGGSPVVGVGITPGAAVHGGVNTGGVVAAAITTTGPNGGPAPATAPATVPTVEAPGQAPPKLPF